MKKNSIKLLIIVLILVSIFYIYKFFKYRDKDGFYNLGKDKISSIEKIVGNRNLDNKNTRTSKYIIKEYRYTNVKDVTSDLSVYTEYLIDNYYFTPIKDYDLSFNTGSIHLASNSKDNDYIIILDIKYSEKEYTIKFTKGKGKINILNNF